MNLTPITKATGCLVVAFLMTSPPASSAAVSRAQSCLVNAETPVAVRNKTAPVGTRSADRRVTAAKPVAKESQKHDKSTINRCWQRLMAMAREANTAHRNKKD